MNNGILAVLTLRRPKRMICPRPFGMASRKAKKRGWVTLQKQLSYNIPRGIRTRATLVRPLMQFVIQHPLCQGLYVQPPMFIQLGMVLTQAPNFSPQFWGKSFDSPIAWNFQVFVSSSLSGLEIPTVVGR